VGRVEAALTTPGRASTVRWSGSGKRIEKVYVRNQRLKASQENPPAPIWRMWAGLLRAPELLLVRGTPGLGEVAGLEAIRKACGVLMAMRQGHSWAPNSINGHAVNVGTVLAVPHPPAYLVGGKVRRRLMPSGRGGGPVVVRGRESRPHGEGVQRDRSLQAEQGGRW
jgi:hypothetical protein